MAISSALHTEVQMRWTRKLHNIYLIIDSNLVSLVKQKADT